MSVTHRAITVDDYHRMGEAGVFAPGERVELIEGELYRMPPIGQHHCIAVDVLTRRLILALGEQAVVSVQNPIALRPTSEPQPDLMVLRPEAWRRPSTPQAEDTLLVIEVADSSLAMDRDIKLPLYARHGIPVVWLIDVQARVVSCHDLPVGGHYSRTVEKRPGEQLQINGLPQVTLAVEELFSET